MKSKKGFTLIELIVVLAILAIIAAIAVPTAFGSIEKARVAADKATMDSINSAIRVSATLYATEDETAKKALTVGTALTDAGITSVEWQSAGNDAGAKVIWVEGAAGAMGHYEWGGTGTAYSAAQVVFNIA